MLKQVFVFLLPVLMAHSLVFAQTGYDFSREEVKARVKIDVYTLASEEMEGRESGTEGEVKAAQYIKSRMQEIGLEPLFDGSFVQTFPFFGAWEAGPDNFLIVNEQEFLVNDDFYALPGSYMGRAHAQAVYVGFGLEEDVHNDYAELDDLAGKIFFMEFFLPQILDEPNTRHNLDVTRKKIETAIEKGASAIIFVNTQSNRPNPTARVTSNMQQVDIPLLFAREEVFEFWQQMGQGSDIFLSAELERPSHISMNVAGYIDNQAPTTIVIGGHFDHLGYGGGGSRSPGVQQIHPGADDNASGVAGVLESARFLLNSDFTSNNYIFIAFGAEEKGLLGSRHFTESGAYDMAKVNFMFNYDMIGRSEEGSLMLFGTGTSPVWDDSIDRHSEDLLQVQKRPSGMGGSDHTHFYRQDIPVLFFFTGIHEDYHRPSDTPDKVNYEGIIDVLTFSHNMIAELNAAGKLEFTPTPAASARAQRRGTGPSLGLMPDHAWEGEGLKVLAVMDNSPARKAGLKNGDTITRLNEENISDINTYMEALRNIEAGSLVKVQVIREGELVQLKVQL